MNSNNPVVDKKDLNKELIDARTEISGTGGLLKFGMRSAVLIPQVVLTKFYHRLFDKKEYEETLFASQSKVQWLTERYNGNIPYTVALKECTHIKLTDGNIKDYLKHYKSYDAKRAFELAANRCIDYSEKSDIVPIVYKSRQKIGH